MTPTQTTPGFYCYQVLGVRGTTLVTLRSFWADDDATAARIAGPIPPGAVLARVVENVQR